MRPHPSCRHGVTRRGFLAGAALGLAAGAPLAWYVRRNLTAEQPRFTGKSGEVERPQYAMPGRFPGRVIRVHHPAAVRPRDHTFDEEVVRKMVHRGVTSLVG